MLIWQMMMVMWRKSRWQKHKLRMELSQQKPQEHAPPATSAEVQMEIDDAIIELGDWENQYEKGNKDQPFCFVQENIIVGNQCISMKMLSEIYGFDGTDKRHYVKKVIELEFGERLILITILNEPQVAGPCRGVGVGRGKFPQGP